MTLLKNPILLLLFTTSLAPNAFALSDTCEEIQVRGVNCRARTGEYLDIVLKRAVQREGDAPCTAVGQTRAEGHFVYSPGGQDSVPQAFGVASIDSVRKVARVDFTGREADEGAVLTADGLGIYEVPLDRVSELKLSFIAPDRPNPNPAVLTCIPFDLATAPGELEQ